MNVILASMSFHIVLKIIRDFLHMSITATGKMLERLSSYWEANMELIDIIPVFNLYEEFWKIYTRTDAIPPQYICRSDAFIEKSISR